MSIEIKEDKPISVRAALSLASLLVILNFALYFFAEYRFGYGLYLFVVVNTIFIGPVFLFLELTGKRKTLLNWWNKLPNFVHNGLLIIDLFWTSYLVYTVLLPFTKKDYEKKYPSS